MRKGFDGLAALVQDHLARDPFSGQALVFRGRQGHLINVMWWDGQGLCLFAKRLEKGRFVRLAGAAAAAALTPAQLAMLLEGIDRRTPMRTNRPRIASSRRARFANWLQEYQKQNEQRSSAGTDSQRNDRQPGKIQGLLPTQPLQIIY